MTAAPAGQKKADAPNEDAITNATNPPKTPEQPQAPVDELPDDEKTPVIPGPNDPIGEGQVQVTRKADPKKAEAADPSGNVIETKKATRASKSTKKDPLKEEIDLTHLPVAVAVGQVAASIKEYSGQAILEVSLVGWVGDAPFKIRASDVAELEDALASLREQLG